jgi:DNA-binding XRE family transcriptional regulator
MTTLAFHPIAYWAILYLGRELIVAYPGVTRFRGNLRPAGQSPGTHPKTPGLDREADPHEPALVRAPFPVRLGRRLSDLRENRGLSQTQLADMAGIGRANLSQIENGAASARIDTLHALAQALDLKLEELFRGF